MTRHHSPPFAATDIDRCEIWEMLVRRDFRAYLDRDWNAIADDFVDEGFFGIDAECNPDPGSWRIAFADVASYRDEWLQQAEQTHLCADPENVEAALYAATTLTEIELRGDFALARKKFCGPLPNRDGSSTMLQWQTLYVCRKVGTRWKIASFVGYMPYEQASCAGWDVAASKQHKTAGPYSPVVAVDATARIFVISGQAPLDAEGRVVGTTIAEQSRVTLENCRAQLEAAGCSLADVFKATVYLTDLGNWQTFNEVYREYMRAPFPARTAVQTGLLPEFLVEVEMWAAKR